MQNYSIVNSAVRVWDRGKNSNRALKWGGEMVESVVGGVVQRLEPLEPFAVRQLDRVIPFRPEITNGSLKVTSTRPHQQKNLRTKRYPHPQPPRHHKRVDGRTSSFQQVA